MDTTVDKKTGKKQKIILGLVIFLVLIIIALVTGYFIGENHYKSHFLKGTKINGIDVSGQSVDELNNRVQQYTLTVVYRTDEGETKQAEITGEEIGLHLTSDGELEEVLEKQQGGKWLFGKGKTYQFEELTEYEEDKWEDCLDNLTCFDKAFVTEPEDAYVKADDENKTFTLEEEVEGNEVDREKASRVLTQAVQKLQGEVDLEAEDCYESPKITTEDKELKAFYDKLKQYTDVDIYYQFGDEKEELTGEDIYGWLVVDYDNQTVSLNPDNVTEYVSYLKWKHDSIFSNREFKTTYGQTVTVPGGDYGWWMDKETEVSELTAMIDAGQSGERKPVYFQEAAQYGDNDFGNTYIEINLTSQHLFLYVNGEMILESDFVSGRPSNGHATPAGTYAMTYTERYATLNGENYSTPVSFWMPFNEDIGLHDATWKSEFGSNFYQSAGSHGCINLPYHIAEQIFQYAYKAMPVICYELPGTESTSVTIQTDEEKAQGAITAINDIATATNKANMTKTARKVYNDLRTASAKAQVTNYSDLLYYESIYN